MSDRKEAVAARSDQIDECRLVTMRCSLDEVAIHRHHQGVTPMGGAVHLYR